MKREILCVACAAKTVPMHPQDVLNGFKRRITPLAVKKPDHHGLTINGEFKPLRSLVCDHCAQPITDGTRASAVTWWNTHREDEPGLWEEEYEL
jgi:hypothetical protein